jgi:hypothetical protein
LLFTSTAAAYRTAGDRADYAGSGPVRWTDGRIDYQLYVGVPSDMYLADVEAEVLRAVARWETPACSAVDFSYGGVTYVPAAPDDGQNTIQWLTSGWEDRGFAPDEAGITDVTYEQSGSDWHIVEADTYVNALDFQWVLGGTPPAGYRDVTSVITHESGHMLGLLHPCEIGGKDGAPDCAAAGVPPTTTMYPVYDPAQANLSADDVAGVCFLYPRASCDQLGCPDGTRCVDGRCAELCQGEVCAADQVCTAQGCAQPERPDSPTACSSDADCSATESCLNGVCGVRYAFAGDPCDGVRYAFAGDPCDGPEQCPNGVCSAEGYCAESCAKDADCTTPERCVTNADGPGACTADTAPLGAKCGDPTECAGGECLANDGPAPVCTRLCSADAACPDDWYCDSVDGRSVCRTPVRASGGCAVVSRVGTAPTHAPLSLALLVLAFVSAKLRRGQGKYRRSE